MSSIFEIQFIRWISEENIKNKLKYTAHKFNKDKNYFYLLYKDENSNNYALFYVRDKRDRHNLDYLLYEEKCVFEEEKDNRETKDYDNITKFSIFSEDFNRRTSILELITKMCYGYDHKNKFPYLDTNRYKGIEEIATIDDVSVCKVNYKE